MLAAVVSHDAGRRASRVRLLEQCCLGTNSTMKNRCYSILLQPQIQGISGSTRTVRQCQIRYAANQAAIHAGERRTRDAFSISTTLGLWTNAKPFVLRFAAEWKMRTATSRSTRMAMPRPEALFPPLSVI